MKARWVVLGLLVASGACDSHGDGLGAWKPVDSEDGAEFGDLGSDASREDAAEAEPEVVSYDSTQWPGEPYEAIPEDAEVIWCHVAADYPGTKPWCHAPEAMERTCFTYWKDCEVVFSERVDGGWFILNSQIGGEVIGTCEHCATLGPNKICGENATSWLFNSEPCD